VATSAQSTQPTGQTTPKPAPKKPPQEPIDPNETAGVRGSGSPLTVRVLIKGKAVENAHVVVKNSNGTLAGSCFTNATGECKVDVGPDDYEIDATGNGRTGTLKLHVSAATRTVSIKLLKAKTTGTAVKP
jgi:uncharacterized protein with FMN-binding domain